jgi:hypothetical protein
MKLKLNNSVQNYPLDFLKQSSIQARDFSVNSGELIVCAGNIVKKTGRVNTEKTNV